MKKGLLLALASQVTFASIAWSANVIELTFQPNDLKNYLQNTKYQFSSEVLFKANNEPQLRTEKMETRGQGSLSYARKNFDVKLEEKTEVGRIKSKKINLLSMGGDTGYIATRLGLLSAELLNIGKGLPTEYTEVKINGITNGVYTIVEKPKEALDKSPYVVRRGYKSRFITDEAEISKKITPEQVKEIEKAGAALYADVASKKGEELFNSLKQRMDIESYMRWMVLNSLLKNGDFPDEVFFYVDADLYKQGRIYFRILTWDYDDCFKGMHGVKNGTVSSNIKAVKDPANAKSILYSYEDLIDRAFAPVNAVMYSKLTAVAKSVLTNELSKENMDRVINKLRSEILPYIERQDILAISKKDSGRKTPYTKEEILNLFAQRNKEIDDRRIELLNWMK